MPEKFPVSLPLPPCSLLWSDPAWSQARNNHYCLTRKAASSAEGGAFSQGHPVLITTSYQVVTEHLPASLQQSAHLGEGLGVQMWLLEEDDIEFLLCQAQAQPGTWTVSEDGKYFIKEANFSPYLSASGGGLCQASAVPCPGGSP